VSSFISLAEQHIRSLEHGLAVLSMTGEAKCAGWEKMRGTMCVYQDRGLPGIV